MALPCLPGNDFNHRAIFSSTCNYLVMLPADVKLDEILNGCKGSLWPWPDPRQLGREKFHKSHHFDINNEVAMLVGEEKPGIGGELLLGQKRKPKNSVYPKGEGSSAPTWVAFDRQVLSFEAYFQEAVHEKREEQFRVRKCKIYFYLEDDSIQVIEPLIKNSGIPQGTLIRRHRIPLPAPNDDEFYTVEHFNIGNEIVLYGRKFKLTDCDVFTRNFLRKLGVRVNKSDRIPSDPYTSLRKDMEESMQPLRPYERTDTLQQFLSHDRHVLRFWCFWDDTECMFGDNREMNAPLPLRQPGEKTDRTVLNVFGPMGHGGRYILDSLKTGAVYEDFYTDADLVVGAVLNVWGRKLVLCDCDNFTKEFYRSKYGIDDFKTIKYKADPAGAVPRPVPPYNGFGSEEDSLCSCMGLIPKPPQRDFIKFMEKDRHGLESNVLRFVAYMATDNPIEKERKFIISYFLSDDTVAVFEPPQRNSGVIGGKFLERGRIKKPNQPLLKSEMSEYFCAQDFFVGANVTINEFNFTIVDADEYAFRYMEKHENEFPVADMSVIMDKLRSAVKDKAKEVKEFFVMNDPNQSQTVRYESFRNLLAQLNTFSEHDIMTIGRHYARREPEEVDVGLVLAVAQERLKKKNFEDFARLKESLAYEDMAQRGTLPAKALRAVCRAFKLPLPEDVLQVLLKKLSTNDEINYNDFVSKLNWRENPVAAVQYQQLPIKLDTAWKSGNISQVTAVLNVDYKRIVEDVFGSQDS